MLLELLDWVFRPQGSEEVGFVTRRLTETQSGSASLWKISENGKVGLKHSVCYRLVALGKSHLLGKLAFEPLLHAVWFLICARDGRYSALKLVKILESIVPEVEAELAEDPDRFLTNQIIPTFPLPILKLGSLSVQCARRHGVTPPERGHI